MHCGTPKAYLHPSYYRLVACQPKMLKIKSNDLEDRKISLEYSLLSLESLRTAITSSSKATVVPKSNAALAVFSSKGEFVAHTPSEPRV